MTDIMPSGADFNYQDVDMDIDMGYLDTDTMDNNVYPTVRK
jgi:hypothetical protein